VVVPNWTVKLRTGGRLVDVVGEVRWVPGPSPLPWLAGAALLAMAVVAAGRTRRWREALVAALALVVGLDLVQVAGAVAAAQAPLASVLPSIAASAAGWVLAALAIRQLLRRRLESGLFQLLLAAGLLTVVGGLGDLGFLLRSQLPTGLPDWMVRFAVAAKIGLGVGALAAAGLRLRVTVRDWAPADEDWAPADEGRAPAHPPVDIHEHPARPSATLPLRGAEPPGAGFQPALQEGEAARQREPAAAHSTLATVLPWPGPRRSGDHLDDPDLPGGA
jgi:hypothetical protein